jgi:WD40 repeat protein/tRNA A-37 threonylcarbamoyl transferase component Bud32
MPQDNRGSSPQQAPLDVVIAAYLRAVELGMPVDREELIARHPQLADHLRAFFAAQDVGSAPRTDAEVEKVRTADPTEAPTLPPSGAASGEQDAETLPPRDYPTPGTTGAVHSALRTPNSALGTVRYFGDYELLEEIARGGMGVVYKARQVSLNRIVALKMILAGQLASEEDVRRFYTEAEAAANLDHPGIVPIYEVGQHEGQHYFSMGFVEGQSLAAKVAAGPLPPRDAAELVLKVAEAIAYAHERGVIHRDLKPGNILLDKTGQPRVTDFGLAKHVTASPASGGRQPPDSASADTAPHQPAHAGRSPDRSGLTLTGQVLGTPSYMPPEQAAGKLDEIGPLSDVYSLGAVLYTLLTGRPPFHSANKLDTLRQVLEQDPVPPRDLNAGVPVDLDTICHKCLEKKPGRRYGSARGLAEELQRFLNGEPILARPIGRVERAARWAARHPARAATWALSLLTVVLGTLGGTAFWQWVRADSALVVATQQRKEADTQRERAEESAEEEKKQRAEAEKQKAEADTQRGRAEREHLRAEGLVYAGQISLAQGAWDGDDARLAWDHLNATRADFRAWEHDYLVTLFNKNQRTCRGHAFWVRHVVFSPDGKRIVSGSSDRTLKIWDATSGQVVLTLKGHTAEVRSVAFSPDGKRVVSGSGDNTLKIWDAANGQEVRTLKGHTQSVSSVAFSADGKRIVSGSYDLTLKIWDAATGQEVLTLKGHTGNVSSVALSADGKRIVSGSGDNTLKIWDAATGQEVLTLKGHTAAVVSVALSADGKRIVSASPNNTLKIWDAMSGQELRTLNGHTDIVTSVAFSADGKRIVSGSVDKTLKIWNATNGQPVLTLKGHTQAVHSVAFSPDGKRIVSGSGDNTLKVWGATSGQGVLTLDGHMDVVRSVAFSPDGKRVVSGSGDSTLKIWDATSGQEVRTLKGHMGDVYGFVSSVAFSPNGKRIVSGSYDHTLKIWDATSGQGVLTLKGHTAAVYSVAFSPDGKRIVSGSGDNTLKIWDATSGQELHTLKGHMGDIYSFVSSVAFSPDGKRIISGGVDRTLKVWDATSGEELFTLKGHTAAVLSVAFSPNGKRIVSGSYDNRLKIWDATSGQELLTLKGHTGLPPGVESVAFSPDGKRIVSGSTDHTLKIWDATNGQEVLTLKGHTGWVYSVAFSPDGKRIVSGSRDRTLRIWDASQGPGSSDADAQKPAGAEQP